jgi:hypothetical protein
MAGLPEPDSAYALFLGVEHFEDAMYASLPTSRAAVGELARLMGDPMGVMWRLPPDRIKILGQDDGQVTTRQAQAALKEATEGEHLDALLVCISSHGQRYPDDGYHPRGLHLAMTDSDADLPGTHLHIDEICDLLVQAARYQRIRHVLLIVDACYADGTKVQPGQGGGDAAEKDRPAVPGVVVLFATRDRVMAWPHWNGTPWTAFLGALIESIGNGGRRDKKILTAVDVFESSSARLAQARKTDRRVPVPDIGRSGLADVPLCRNNAFDEREQGKIPPELGFTDPGECFTAIQAAREAGRTDDIPDIVASFCGRDDVPEDDVARFVHLLITTEATELASYLPDVYKAACAHRNPADIALLADSLHRYDAPVDARLVNALHGRDQAGPVAAEVYQRMLGSACLDCQAGAELIGAEIVADPQLAAAALAAWL